MKIVEKAALEVLMGVLIVIGAFCTALAVHLILN